MNLPLIIEELFYAASALDPRCGENLRKYWKRTGNETIVFTFIFMELRSPYSWRGSNPGSCIHSNVLINILLERIADERFIRLIRKFMKEGYIEDWQFHNTYSGTPQGGIISPILANIYLDNGI